MLASHSARIVENRQAGSQLLWWYVEKKTEQQQWNMRENAHDDVFKKSRSQLALMSDF